MTPAPPPGGRPSAPTRRKLVHVAFGLVALCCGTLPASWLLLLLLAALAHNVLLLPRYAPGIVRSAEGWPDPGIVLYPGILLLLALLLLPDRPELLAVAWVVLAFGDGLATLAGRRHPDPRLPWNPSKSVAGSAAFVVAGTLGAAAALWLVPGATEGRTPGAIAAAALLVALGCALVESLDSAVDDNLLVPPVAAALAWLALDLDSSWLPLAAPALPAALAVNGALAAVAALGGAVTLTGAVAGILLGVTVWISLGAAGYLPFVVFVVAGSLATRLGRARKEHRGFGEPRRGRRSAANAVANTGVAALLALLSHAVSPGSELEGLFVLGAAASLAAALADTVGSEIGKLRAGPTRRLVGWRPVAPGSDGGVSAAGTVAAIGGACLVAMASVPLLGGGLHRLAPVALGGVAGMLADGLLGGAIRKPRPADNHVVNALGTSAGALAAMGLAALGSP